MATTSPVKVDDTRLDWEWVNQPETFYEAATDLAEARFKVAEAKASLEVIEATVARRVRLTPDKYGVAANPTVAAVDGAVKVSKEYTEALDRLNKAKYRQDMCQALVDALDHKKKALESLAYLHGQNYNSMPKMRDQSPEMDRAAKRAKVKKSRGED
jgi:hypothetical protein